MTGHQLRANKLPIYVLPSAEGEKIFVEVSPGMLRYVATSAAWQALSPEGRKRIVETTFAEVGQQSPFPVR